MNKRNLRLEKYGISGKRYKELCGFCEQYPDWKREIADFPFVKAVNYKPTPGSPNVGTSDPTATNAIKIEQYMHNCQLIEEVAKQADSEKWEFIIKSVCYEVPIAYLETMEGMYLSKSAFYERRRYFFFLLDKAKS